jgi:hypothetical protein
MLRFRQHRHRRPHKHQDCTVVVQLAVLLDAISVVFLVLVNVLIVDFPQVAGIFVIFGFYIKTGIDVRTSRRESFIHKFRNFRILDLDRLFLEHCGIARARRSSRSS